MLKPVLGSQIRLGHPLAKGLVGCWLMNEGSGDKVQDLSGNQRTGTLSSTATWSAADSGPGVNCAANGQKITTVIPVLGPTGTCVIRFNGNATPATLGRFFAAEGGTASFYLSRSTSTALQFEIGGIGGIVTYGALWGTGWHTIVVTWDDAANLRTHYLNGKYVDQTTTAFVFPTNFTSFTIGDRVANDRTVGGQFSWFSLFNRVLSASEIAQLYREPFCMFGKRKTWWSYAGAEVEAAGFMTTNTRYWG